MTALLKALSQRLLIITGKGGTGKSTLAMALARTFAAQGEKTLLATVSSGGNLPDTGQLAQRIPAPCTTAGTSVSDQSTPSPDVVQLNAREGLKAYLDRRTLFGSVYRGLVDTPLFAGFVDALPGFEELLWLGQLHHFSTGSSVGRSGAGVYDRVIFDAPATGHARSLLDTPAAVLKSVPAGPIHDAARSVRRTLSDPAQTAVLLTTLAEELPVAEAAEFIAHLTGNTQVAVAGVLANRIWPIPEALQNATALVEQDSAEASSLQPVQFYLQIAREQQIQLRRLREASTLPLWCLADNEGSALNTAFVQDALAQCNALPEPADSGTVR